MESLELETPQFFQTDSILHAKMHAAFFRHLRAGLFPAFIRGMVEGTKIKNVSAWRLNKAESEELGRRAAAGEEHDAVKRELQQKKAEAAAERKAAAEAVAEKCQRQVTKPAAKGKAAPAPKTAIASGRSNAQLSDAANKDYMTLVQSDILTILTEFGPEFQTAAPLAITADESEAAGVSGCGVQEPYSQAKCLCALQAHGYYRCSVSIWSLSLTSATPGIPLSRKRTSDLSTFYFEDGKPKFHTDKMFEVAVSRRDVEAAQLASNSLQLISPEEMLHATFLGCATAVRSFACIFVGCTGLMPFRSIG